MMYGAETWEAKKAQEKKLDVADMRILRWIIGIVKLDRGTRKWAEYARQCRERV